ncbi:NAD(P)H-dependent glycerol-3-phosphate dehydrogenase [bacterium]|nr:NAD(P)H-dependent glycerol-3-phosphate dehydrogenase [bacterium]
MDNMQSIAVIGGGGWGSTIAKILGENGHQVRIWCHKAPSALQINRNHTTRRLPGVMLPESVTATHILKAAMQSVDAVVIALSSSQFEHIPAIKSTIPSGAPILLLTKGLAPDDKTLLISDYLRDQLPGHSIAHLSGPNIAKEIADKKPSATVVASEDEAVADMFQALLSNDYFRVYRSQDCRGVELGGVLKNCIAIAAGISDGLNLGSNAKSTLITRGIREIIQVGCAMNGKEETFYGLSGLGDLMATCFSPHSRNWQFGNTLAKNIEVKTIIDNLKSVTEGLKTTRIVTLLAKENGWDLPIMNGVYRVIYENVHPSVVIQEWMSRELKAEANENSS